MALRAGYYGVKKTVLSKLLALSNLGITGIGDGLTITDGILSATGSGGVSIELKDWAKFDGSKYISLPFKVRANHKITVEFDNETEKTESIYGNSNGDGYSHLTIYQGKYYISKQASPDNFTGTTTGKHTYIENDNGECLFDDVKVADITVTDQDYNIYVGYRANGGGYYDGKINKFIITDTTDDSKVCELLPAMMVTGSGDYTVNQPGLYDTINKKWYYEPISEVGDYVVSTKKRRAK